MENYTTLLSKTSFFSTTNLAKVKIIVLCGISLLITSSSFSNSIHSLKKTYSIPMIRLMMNGYPNYLDETVLYYQIGATDGFDSDYDAYKLMGPNPAPHISQEYCSTLMAINGINPVAQTFSININTTTHITGNFTITAIDFSFLPAGTCVILKDLVTGNTVDILNTPYAFNLSNTTTSSRFSLTINHFELSLTSNITQPSCQLLNNGKCKVTPQNNPPWNYIWKDSLGATIKSTIGSFDSDSLNNINAGSYDLEVTSASNICYSNSNHFTINKIIKPTIMFSLPDTIIASISQNCTPINQSLNCISFDWKFGEENGYSAGFEPTHAYSVSGVFKTTLIGTSNTGCVDSLSKFTQVLDYATSIKNNSAQHIKLLTIGNKKYIIDFKNNSNSIDLNINLYNITGEQVYTNNVVLNELNQIHLDFSDLKNNIYFLNIKNKGTDVYNHKLIVQ